MSNSTAEVMSEVEQGNVGARGATEEWGEKKCSTALQSQNAYFRLLK